MGKKLISIVLPAYREEKNISLVYEEILKNLEKISEKYDFEMIFVNDGSPDNTWEEILKVCQKDDRVKGLNLSRNFGHQAALTAGLDIAVGDVVISMDADIQHPPEIVPKMIEKYEEGNNIVYARVLDRDVTYFKKNFSIWYYKILSKISDTNIPRNVGDFRLVDKKVLDVFRSLKEKDRYIRGMMAWAGFKYDFVDFKVPKRIYGSSSYTWKKMWKLASDGVLNFSTFPLKIGLILGILMMICAFCFFVYVTGDWIIHGTYYPLYKWLTIGMFGFMGLQFIFMWILGEYIGRIYNETRDRPIYIISDKKNF